MKTLAFALITFTIFCSHAHAQDTQLAFWNSESQAEKKARQKAEEAQIIAANRQAMVDAANRALDATGAAVLCTHFAAFTSLNDFLVAMNRKLVTGAISGNSTSGCMTVNVAKEN